MSDLLETVIGAGLAVYFIDTVTGKRKRVYVKNKSKLKVEHIKKAKTKRKR